MKSLKKRKLTRKQKNLLGLVSVVVLIGISIAVWLLSKGSSTIDQDFHIQSANKIVRIVIKDKSNNSSELDKKTDSLWYVNKKYEANLTLVNTVLSTLEQMRIREPIPKSAKNSVIKDLAADGRTVEVYTEDYLIDFWFVRLFKRTHLAATYFVGHETPDEMGTFMLRKGDKTPYVIYIPNFRGYLATRFTAKEDAWRTHNIFKYKQSEIESISIELPSDKSESFTLVNNGKGFSFVNANGQTVPAFDTTKVVALLSSFVEMNYERLARNITPTERDTIFTKDPSFVITVKDKKGKTEYLKTFVKLADPNSIATDENDFYQIFDINRCYALTSKMADTLIMQFFTLDNVLKPASYFMPGAEGLPYIK
ncbi:MAG: DUF4340 domain-containing protein [Bacteroidales bacterium]|nr:DUF4340 domain-containing protein [Bacteroidales bacterium]